jgi:hypothetical protein
MTAPLGAAFALTTFAFAPVSHTVLTGFTMLTPFRCAAFPCFMSLVRFVCATGLLPLAPFVLAALTRFMALPGLVLLRLSRRHIVIAPAALLPVVPARGTTIVIGDMLNVLAVVVAPTIVIAVVSATVVGKGAAR